MWTYALFLVIVLVQALIFFIHGSTERKKMVFLTIVFFEMLILSGLRGLSVGTDTIMYADIFYLVGPMESFGYLAERFESGFLYLVQFLYSITPDPQLLIFTSAFFILFTTTILIYKESPSVWLSVYLYITLMYFYAGMNVMRQSVAIGFIVFAYFMLKEKRYSFFFLFVFAATLFHSSSLVFILLFPLSFIKINFRILGITSLFVLGVYLNFGTALELVLKVFPQYAYYIFSQNFFEKGLLASYVGFLIDICFLVFALFIFKKQRASLDEKQLYEFHLMLYMLLLGTSFDLFSIQGTVIERFANYFTFFIIVFLPKLLMYIQNKQQRYAITAIIMFFTLLHNAIVFVFRPEWNWVIPYVFFWQT